MHYKTWSGDYLRFTVTGRGAQSFLSLCGSNGVKLWQIHCTQDGYSARVAGADRQRLERLAKRGGWALEYTRRIGPGKIAERLLRRPGLIAGGVMFFALTKVLAGFVWGIDFGALDSTAQAELRQSLLQSSICEGAWLTSDKLREAERALTFEAAKYGWISLHFTGGCLFIESSPLQQQSIHGQGQMTALYASCGGVIVSMSVKSGFTVTAPGQYVVPGQLLVDTGKFDRSGNLVQQTAEGAVLARIEKSYTAVCPLKNTAQTLTGEKQESTELYLLGRKYAIDSSQALPPPDTESWTPLQLGAFALPGCLHRQTCWLKQQQTLEYTPKTAQAIAARQCRLQLAQEHPDAVIEAENRQITAVENGVGCTISYVFIADIAAPAAPPEHVYTPEA